MFSPNARLVYLRGGRELIAQRLSQRHGHSWIPISCLVSSPRWRSQPTPSSLMSIRPCPKSSHASERRSASSLPRLGVVPRNVNEFDSIR